MTEQVEVVIIGGGQAGLALSYYLTQQGRTHLVLEQGQVGETWRSGRWDSFTLNTPNWMTQLWNSPAFVEIQNNRAHHHLCLSNRAELTQ